MIDVCTKKNKELQKHIESWWSEEMVQYSQLDEVEWMNLHLRFYYACKVSYDLFLWKIAFFPITISD